MASGFPARQCVPTMRHVVDALRILLAALVAIFVGAIASYVVVLLVVAAWAAPSTCRRGLRADELDGFGRDCRRTSGQWS